jgi:hypothetical protein
MDKIFVSRHHTILTIPESFKTRWEKSTVAAQRFLQLRNVDQTWISIQEYGCSNSFPDVQNLRLTKPH